MSQAVVFDRSRKGGASSHPGLLAPERWGTTDGEASGVAENLNGLGEKTCVRAGLHNVSGVLFQCGSPKRCQENIPWSSNHAGRREI